MSSCASSRQRTLSLLLLVSTIICALMGTTVTADTTDQQQLQANWSPCGGELKAPSTVTDLQVFVGPCQAVNGTESRCALRKGTNATMTIKFKTTVAVPSLERIIVAQVPTPLDKRVEMPYGPPISPCTNQSDGSAALTSTEDGSVMDGCVSDGVVANRSYTYVSQFEVLPSFPTVSDIDTRVILRQQSSKHRKIRLYRKHPGPTVFCVLIPHIEVTD